MCQLSKACWRAPTNVGAQTPKSAVLYYRLAQVTGWQSDVDARWLALVGLEALGMPSIDQRQLFADNSVLRGQAPRVDETVPN